uniref:Uncharacterized protein n=1 Tax=Tetraselmis sp. GSL018 TaxID=582737 RepID=A0A061SB83_9CHLO
MVLVFKRLCILQHVPGTPTRQQPADSATACCVLFLCKENGLIGLDSSDIISSRINIPVEMFVTCILRSACLPNSAAEVSPMCLSWYPTFANPKFGDF